MDAWDRNCDVDGVSSSCGMRMIFDFGFTGIVEAAIATVGESDCPVDCGVLADPSCKAFVVDKLTSETVVDAPTNGPTEAPTDAFIFPTDEPIETSTNAPTNPPTQATTDDFIFPTDAQTDAPTTSSPTDCSEITQQIENFPEITTKAQRHQKITLLKSAKLCEKAYFAVLKEQGFQTVSQSKNYIRTQKRLSSQLRATEKLQVRSLKQVARVLKKAEQDRKREEKSQ